MSPLRRVLALVCTVTALSFAWTTPARAAETVAGTDRQPRSVPLAHGRAEPSRAPATTVSVGDDEQDTACEDVTIACLRKEIEELREAASNGSLSDSDLQALEARLDLLQAKLDTAQLREREEAQKEQATKTFLGFQWSLGIAAVVDLGAGERVRQAEVVNGIVRITEQESAAPRILMEVHKLFSSNDDKTFGIGPFVAIQAGDGEVVDAFGAGVLFGWRRSKSDSSSVNLGVGVLLDPNVQVLGDGLTKDAPLPQGETQIRFKQEARYGLLVLASFSF